MSSKSALDACRFTIAAVSVKQVIGRRTRKHAAKRAKQKSDERFRICDHQETVQSFRNFFLPSVATLKARGSCRVSMK